MAEKSGGVGFGAEGARPVSEEWARGRARDRRCEEVSVERSGPEGGFEADDAVGRTA